jgi:transcriptional antiterminator NusG
MIYIVRTTSGREEIVLDMLGSRVKAQGLDIKAIFHPAEIKGYIFVEGSLGALEKAIQGVMHIKGLIKKPIKIDEIRHFLEYKKEGLKIDIGDIVEIIGGPFKGEKGKIQRISKNKDEITVELLEAATPIPVTIATEFVKVIKRSSESDKNEREERN